MNNYTPRISLTPKAAELIDKLRSLHGELIFHQSGGCCDGSVPMCLAKDDFYLGSADLFLGNIHECGFYMHRDNFEYFKNTHITLDVTSGRGSGFSLENGSGERFITRQRLFNHEEEQNVFSVNY